MQQSVKEPSVGDQIVFSESDSCLCEVSLPSELVGRTAVVTSLDRDSDGLRVWVRTDDHEEWWGFWMEQILPADTKLSSLTSRGKSFCPLCGSSGDDLVFAFYCNSEICPNHR
jgi:hypothetical protein